MNNNDFNFIITELMINMYHDVKINHYLSNSLMKTVEQIINEIVKSMMQNFRQLYMS